MNIPEEAKLTPKEIGDNLDLNIEDTYPKTDGAFVTTISIRKVASAASEKAYKVGRCDLISWLIGSCNEHYTGNYTMPRYGCIKCISQIRKELEQGGKA